MFVTLKSEVYPPILIELRDNSTIGEMKEKLELSLEIPIHQQKISSLRKSYQDDDIIRESLSGEEANGGVLFLYTTYNNYDLNENGDFCGFLNVFYNEDSAKKNIIDLKKDFDSKKTPKTFAQLAANEPIVIESSQDTQSQSTSDESSEEDSEISKTSEDEDDEESPKPHHESSSKRNIKRPSVQPPVEIMTKRARNSLTHEEYFYEYLEEDPALPSQEANNSEQTLEAAKKPTIEASNEVTSTKNSSDSEYYTPEDRVSIDLNFVQKKPSSKSLSNIQNINHSDIQVYSILPPQEKQYLLVLTNGAEITKAECNQFLMKFMKCFEADFADFLSFNQNHPITLYEDKLWIACSNKESLDWVLLNVAKLFNDKYLGRSFSKFYDLKPCQVVMPNILKSTDWSNVLKILSIQNRGLITDKWVVDKVAEVQSNADNPPVSVLCPNVLISFSLDNDSKDYISKNNYKLRYCFWTLFFKFDDENNKSVVEAELR